MKHVFIVTYGRSGSTLLQNILNSIPGYLIRGENKNALFGLFQSTGAAREAKDKFRNIQHLPVNHPWFGAEKIPPVEYRDELIASFTRHIIRPTGSERAIGFKEISYFLDNSAFPHYMDFLLSAFEEAYVVFNIRNPDEVIKSGWWTNWRPDEATSAINSYIGMMRDYNRGCDRSIIVDYNAYIEDPDFLIPLFEFLGEHFDRNRIEDILSVRLRH